MRFIPLLSALNITGHDTVSGLDQWIRRYNRANPGAPVLRMSGKVDTESLRIAVRAYATHRTTSRNMAAAIETAGMKKRQTRANASAAHKRSQP